MADLSSKERLQEAEALIAMLSNDMDQHDFTRGYLPHWRPRLRAFLEGRPATYDPKDAPQRAFETSPDRDCACNLVTGCRVKGGESLLKGYRCRAPETSAKCATHATEYRLIGTLPCPWCVIDELKRNRDALAAETTTEAGRSVRTEQFGWCCTRHGYHAGPTCPTCSNTLKATAPFSEKR